MAHWLKRLTSWRRYGSLVGSWFGSLVEDGMVYWLKLVQYVSLVGDGMVYWLKMVQYVSLVGDGMVYWMELVWLTD